MRKTMAAQIGIPAECTRTLAISAAVIIVFVLAAVVPGYLVKKHLDSKVLDARQELAERNSLLPLYETLEKEKTAKTSRPGPASQLKTSPGQAGPSVVSSEGGSKPAGTSLGMADLGGALAKITDISRRSSMAGLNITAGLNNAVGPGHNAYSLPVDVSFRGSFGNFRVFLLDICALPYVENVASISIKRTPGSRALDFGAKIMLAMS